MAKQTQSTTKRIYLFGTGVTEGSSAMKELLGGKGANLAEMTAIGLPVPPGFTITTETCAEFLARGGAMPLGLMNGVRDALAQVETSVERRFGLEKPLLLSVRSGAAASMPGMMDTVLNLGLNEQTVRALGDETGSPRFAWDSYRRFITMYSDVVAGLNRRAFDEELEAIKRRTRKVRDADVEAGDLMELCERLLRRYETESGEAFPQYPWEQLERAIAAVFRSWHNERAIAYRHMNRIYGLKGTAVTVQAMVFGNLNDDSATGVGFTRNPGNGENEFFCDILFNAQGEDVVAGIRNPENIDSLEKRRPDIYRQLLDVRSKLERHYGDMQDIEFTIQSGKLYLLQTRNGKRTARAALRIAIDMVDEGLMTREQALLKIEAASLNQLLHPSFDLDAKITLLATGVPASPGAATGAAVFTPEEAEARAAKGEAVILVREETSPEDIKGMAASIGILTARGGRTSHAAVVARQMGKPCVAGCSELRIDEIRGLLEVKHRVLREGDVISLDGASGRVMLGAVPTLPPRLDEDFHVIMGWADEYRRLGIRANADVPRDAEKAREFGAEGIGLCRTEHMFFEEGRIVKVREMILAADAAGRKHALDALLPMQRGDFIGLFKAMDGFPVTIRLLDPPLHEFLPLDGPAQVDVARELGVSPERIRAAVEQLREMNPMLGLRGCRLGIMMPEIYDMQVRAIVEAAHEASRQDATVLPEIMIPLVGTVEELQRLRARAERIIDEFNTEHKAKVHAKIGTMIEVPRAALTADAIARAADFFSFGTNDLTQMTLGVSRDDAEGKFLVEYVVQGIYLTDPFATIDREGVGKLMRMGCELGRRTRSDLKLGICGEHGGDPESVEFCHEIGLDYVSCSPWRVPIARLAAAQAALRERAKTGVRAGHA